MMPLKQGRNDSCACGSGKKYKQCCMLLPKKTNNTPTLNVASSEISEALKTASDYISAGKYQDSVRICQAILQMRPHHQEALNMLGVLAYYAGNNELALNLLSKALNINNQYTDAHNNIAEVYRASGKFRKAISHLQEAIRLKSNYVDALINYGNVLQDIHEYDLALAQYNKVLKNNPSHKGALSNKANLLQQLNRHSEAIVVYEKLITFDENYDYALGGLVYSKLSCCDWTKMSEKIIQINSKVEAGKNVIKPFDLLAISNESRLQFKCAKRFASYQHPSRSLNANQQINHDGKIRIAYISADFRQHPVSQLLAEVIELHNRDKFEIVGISFGADDKSEMRARLLKAFDQFHDVSESSDLDVANLLQNLHVDIAVDLMGYTAGSRMGIFSYHAVPVQVTFLGYAGTSGVDYIDYIISDKVVLPSDDSQWFSEKVVHLPNTFFPRDSKKVASEKIFTRASQGLPDNAFVFCSFNNSYKINPEVFDVWMRLLNQIDESVLWLSSANEMVKSNLIQEAGLRGISEDRLIFAKREEHLQDHLARHKLADLFLDTLPYNAHTTSSDALWAGLPVLTCLGNTFAGRVSASLLCAVGLEELVTKSIHEYESSALKLAVDHDYLTSLKLKLLKNREQLPVFNTKEYTKNLEHVFISMVEDLII